MEAKEPIDMQPLVYLLRSVKERPDPYLEAMREAGYRARCLSVLRFAFPFQEELREHLARPEAYGGIIITSPRAAEALSEAMLHHEETCQEEWQQKPAYAVGPRSAESLRALGFLPSGQHTGRSRRLAQHIQSTEAPLLFLCGNRRRETLPRQLSARGIAFEELTVYETHVRQDLDFTKREIPSWFVFFSPSGVEAVAAAEGLEGRMPRTAAIGPTTAEALEKQGWSPHAVAEHPTPEALTEALRREDAQVTP